MPPPPHVWQVPVVEDMLCDGKSGLTEAIVMAQTGLSCFMEGDYLEKDLAWVRHETPCLHYEGPSVGLASRSNSMPMQ